MIEYGVWYADEVFNFLDEPLTRSELVNSNLSSEEQLPENLIVNYGGEVRDLTDVR